MSLKIKRYKIEQKSRDTKTKLGEISTKRVTVVRTDNASDIYSRRGRDIIRRGNTSIEQQNKGYMAETEMAWISVKPIH